MLAGYFLSAGPNFSSDILLQQVAGNFDPNLTVANGGARF